MRALTTTGTNRSELTIADAPDPVPTSSQAVVDVRATSLNAGEVRQLDQIPDGYIPGWDVAGVVVTEAADGTGPSLGTRVVGLVSEGAWATRCVVGAHALAPIPDGVTYAQAATLPIAGLTALRALEYGGLLVGQRVLVTGAAGGVGRFAVELAHRAGAHVSAVVGRPERASGLAELGADEIVFGMDNADVGYDLILESAGGTSLRHALEVCNEGGTIVSYGRSSHEQTIIDPTWFLTHSDTCLVGLLIFTEVAQRRSGSHALSRLLTLVADGRLRPNLDREESWDNVNDAVRALNDRSVAGKVVLHIE